MRLECAVFSPNNTVITKNRDLPPIAAIQYPLFPSIAVKLDLYLPDHRDNFSSTGAKSMLRSAITSSAGFVFIIIKP